MRDATNWLRAIAAVGFLIGAAGKATADVMIYTDRAAFEAASSPLMGLDFAPLITNGFYEQAYPFGFDLQGQHFIADGRYLDVRQAGALRSDASVYGPLGGYIGVDLAAGTLDVGTNLSGFYDIPGNLVLDYNLADGTSSSYTLATDGGTAFLGIISTIPIESLYYYNTNDYPVIDQFEVSSVPEPSSLVLAGIGGLTSLAGLWRRRRLGGAQSMISLIAWMHNCGRL